MSLILDASMTLSWLIARPSRSEADISRRASAIARSSGASVPALWHLEVANTLLVFERAKRLTELEAVSFLAGLGYLAIKSDDVPAAMLQPRVLELGRRYGLTAYDATYLELTLRTGATLATFDRQLADAARKAGAQVFGDPA